MMIETVRDALPKIQDKRAPLPLHPVNIKVAAEFLDVKVPTMRAWLRKGCGPQFLRMGRLVKYEPEELWRFRKSRAAKVKSREAK